MEREKIEKAISLLKIEQKCFKRANTCDKDCAKCDLVQKDKDLIEMYEVAIDCMTHIQNETDKETAMEITHEATLYEALTCPRCHNVVSKRETWGNSEINMIPNYCPFCGQHLKKESK